MLVNYPFTKHFLENMMEKAVTKRSTAAKSSAAPKTTRAKKNSGVSAEMREKMIADAAYYRAQQHGSTGSGDDIAHWLAAEAEIDTMLRKGGISS
jgi:hypothetical protein